MPSSATSRHPAGLPVLLLALAATGTALAQTSLSDAGEQHRRSQEEAREREQQQEAPRVSLQPPEAVPDDDRSLALPVESPSFRIDRFVLEVPDTCPRSPCIMEPCRRPDGPFLFALQYLERYRGRTIGVQGLKLLMRRLSHRILARGYTTTRLDLPEQDLRGGTLKLHLIPGVIRTVAWADAGGDRSWRSPFPLGPGKLLNIRDLEQGMEQFKRVPSQDVDIALLPGPHPGESDLVLTRRRAARPWRFSLGMDDSGVPATGRLQGSMNAAWDNPLGLSDQLTAGLMHDVTHYRKGSGLRGASLAYTLPYGYWTFSASVAGSDLFQRIAGATRDYTTSGTSRNAEVRVGWLFYRDQTRKDTLQIRTGHRSSRSFLERTEIEVQRRSNSYFELGLLHDQHLGASRLHLALAYRQGVSWFGAQDDHPSSGATSPTFYYRFQTLDLAWSTPLRLGRRFLAYTLTAHGQRSCDPLYASEYLTIGNRWSVRGFDGETTLASENGCYLRNDLDCPLGRGFSLTFGLDAGKIYGTNDAFLPGRTLAGTALGIKGVLGKGLHFNLFVGGPLHQPAHFPNRWPVVGFGMAWQL